MRSAAGVLPDGTPFSVPDDVDHPQPLDIAEVARNNIVYLLLPTRQPGGTETAPADQQETVARFAVAEHEAIDSNAGYQGSATVPIGKLRLRYATEGEGARRARRDRSRPHRRSARRPQRDARRGLHPAAVAQQRRRPRCPAS